MSSELGFSFNSFDWGNYLKTRPLYPRRLYDIVYSYHAAHSGCWNRAYDIGTGVGIVAAELLSSFKHVTASDPSEEYMYEAERFLSSTALPDGKRVSFARHRGEDPLSAEPSSIDLVTVAEAIHFTDPASVLSNAATYLAERGTLAIWVYGMRCVFDDSCDENVQALNEAWSDFWLKFQRFRARFEPNMDAYRIAACRYDCIDYDPNIWGDVHRFHWMSEYGMIDGSDIEPLPSRVREGETVMREQERDFCFVDGDLAWLRRYMRSLFPTVDVIGRFSDEWERVVAAFGPEHKERRIIFPFALHLATKK